MLNSGDIVKDRETETHAVVGGVSLDGFVFYGYLIKDRSEIRWAVRSVDLVHSTNETVIRKDL